jgi:hypothetical protein
MRFEIMSKIENALSFRQSFEQAAALALYLATAFVVAAGAVAMCVQPLVI